MGVIKHRVFSSLPQKPGIYIIVETIVLMSSICRDFHWEKSVGVIFFSGFTIRVTRFRMKEDNMPTSFWKGVISFGMVAIPVKMSVAIESKTLAFHYLHKKCLTRPKTGYSTVKRIFKKKGGIYFNYRGRGRGERGFF